MRPFTNMHIMKKYILIFLCLITVSGSFAQMQDFKFKFYGQIRPTFLKSKVRNGSPVRFSPHMEHEGKYKVYTYYHMRKDISPAITYSISNGIDSWTRVIHKDSVRIEGQTTGEWIELGTYNFQKSSMPYIEISTGDTSGAVIADAVLFIPVK